MMLSILRIAAMLAVVDPPVARSDAGRAAQPTGVARMPLSDPIALPRGVARSIVGRPAAGGRPSASPSDTTRAVGRAPVASRPILFVMPAADTQRLANGRTRRTGYFLNEFYEPYRALVDAGYAVAFASPGGRRPSIDPESLRPRYWKAHPERLAEARALVDTLTALHAPDSLEVARRASARYAGVVVPGGQGVMVDLLGDTVAHAILREVGRAGRPVGLICHAPALLTRLGRADNPFLGRRVTSVSRLEEWYIERVVMKGPARDRQIARALGRSGYRHRRALRPAAPHAVRDGNLVTSQNPFSGARFTALYLEALAATDGPATDGPATDGPTTAAAAPAP